MTECLTGVSTITDKEIKTDKSGNGELIGALH